jgi:hypothetical protein
LIISKVYEDNQAALQTATADPLWLTPRNKLWAIKIHWYRQWLKDGQIMILPISTDDQTADILTKPLSRELFEHHCKVLLGWWLYGFPRASVGRRNLDLLGLPSFSKLSKQNTNIYEIISKKRSSLTI